MKLYALVTNPNAGYNVDKSMVSLLDHFKFYEVEKYLLNRPHNHVVLKDTGKKYNSVNFTYYIFDDTIAGVLGRIKPKEYNILENPLNLDVVENMYINNLMSLKDV